MKLFSTNKKSPIADLKTAVLLGQPPDGGLYFPERLPRLSPRQLKDLRGMDFKNTALSLCKLIFKDELPEARTTAIVEKAFTFSPAIHYLRNDFGFLELFHGPTLAFKDFGARFMASLMGYYAQTANRTLNILVATSGDTGSAVASAFHRVPGIKVFILYPSGKVSRLQELQLTTFDENVTAFEVQGNFDDCQKLVKTAFSDENLRTSLWISSANSINIARLIPQSLYYFWAAGQLSPDLPPPAFIVPSGNFGNLTAGLLAQMMGLNVNCFIAATNANCVIPDYLNGGEFLPRPSIATISNAMDVGNPSNFARMLEVFHNSRKDMAGAIKAFSFSDEETRAAMKKVYTEHNYIIDPHTAVAFAAAEASAKSLPTNTPKILLSTAHPAKFQAEVENCLQISLTLPPELEKISGLDKKAIAITADYESFRKELLSLTTL